MNVSGPDPMAFRRPSVRVYLFYFALIAFLLPKLVFATTPFTGDPFGALERTPQPQDDGSKIQVGVVDDPILQRTLGRNLFRAARREFERLGERENERYLLVVFSYDDPSDDLGTKSHTFATFFKVTRRNGTMSYEPHTICFIPKHINAQLTVAVFLDQGDLARPEISHNYNLTESLDFARRGNRDLWIWGPYGITHEFYRKGLDRIDELSTGRIKWIAFDNATQPAAINCMRAISGIGVDSEPIFHFGFAGTQTVLNRLRLNPGWFRDTVDPRIFLHRRRGQTALVPEERTAPEFVPARGSSGKLGDVDRDGIRDVLERARFGLRPSQR